MRKVSVLLIAAALALLPITSFAASPTTPELRTNVPKLIALIESGELAHTPGVAWQPTKVGVWYVDFWSDTLSYSIEYAQATAHSNCSFILKIKKKDGSSRTQDLRTLISDCEGHLIKATYGVLQPGFDPARLDPAFQFYENEDGHVVGGQYVGKWLAKFSADAEETLAKLTGKPLMHAAVQ